MKTFMHQISSELHHFLGILQTYVYDKECLMGMSFHPSRSMTNLVCLHWNLSQILITQGKL
jgi:hypothetical protein